MELAGTVGKLIYVDHDSAFYIFTVEDASGGRPKKVKGTFVMDKPTPGQFVRLEGQWEKTKWGPTFSAVSLSIPVPETVEGLAEYLQGHVKHIGPVLSRRLVEAFGVDTVHVLDNEPERLETVERLSKRAREELVQAWNDQREYRQIAVDLLRIGLPKTLVTKAYQTWGATTMDRLRANPYALMELDGAGFVLADRLGLGLGLAPDAHARLAGMIEYVLERASQSEGHLYLTLPQLKEQLGRCIHQEGLEGFGRALEMNDLAMAVADLRNRDRVVVDGSRLYLSYAHHAESVAAERLAALLEAPSPLAEVDMEGFLDEYERVQGISLSEQQREAVAAVAEHPVVLVTGLPGTGKTTISKAIVKLFKEQNLRVELMSPTGIAAKRLSSVVGHSASTIHRALGYRGTEWMHGPNNPLQADAVLVDEFSMVDQSLLYHLLGSLKEGAVLVCVGDHAQLPSVGAGNVLHDMIRSQVIPRVNLTQIFRQEEASGIVLAAHNINQGQEPQRGYKDFQFVAVDSERKVVEHIKTLVQRIQQKADRGVTFQVLSPRWAGKLGVTSLNEEIRNVLNPDKGQKAVSVGRGVSWRVGDRVIVMANDYDLGVYNGEQGTIVDIDTSNKEVKVRIRDRHTKVIPIGYKETHKMLKLAFCITIHKSQGSEFDYVILPFVSSYGFQLQRNLFYTAITRAKSKVIMLGEWGAVARAVHNNEVTRRNTHFDQRVRALLVDAQDD